MIPMMRKTLLIGNFGSGNLGDELILSESFEMYPDAIVMTHDAKKSQKFCEQDFQTVRFFPTGFRSLWRFWHDKDHQKELAALKPHITQVVFPGGGLFAIKLKAYFLWFVVFLWVQKYFPEAEIRFEHQGVDVPKDLLSKKFVQYVFRHTDFLSVRDKHSQSAVLDLVDKNVENLGDRVQFQTWNRVPDTAQQKKVLINAIRPLPIEAFQKAFDSVFDEEPLIPVFLAFDESDLKNAQSDFFDAILYPETKSELLQLFLDAHSVIGERFHCLVLGDNICGNEKTFVLRKPYAEKVASFCQEKKIKRF